MKNTKSTAVLIISLIILAAAIIIFRKEGSSNDATHSEIKSNTPSGLQNGDEGANHSTPKKTSLLDRLATRTDDPTGLQGIVRQALASEPGKQRMSEIRKVADFVAENQPEMALEVFEVFRAQPNSQATSDSRLFAREFLEIRKVISPEDAVITAMSLPEDIRLASIRQTTPTWASKDLNGFMEWYESTDIPDVRNASFKRVSEAMSALEDDSTKKTWVDFASNQPEAMTNAPEIVALWSEIDVEEAYHWIAKIESSLVQDQAWNAMADAIAKQDPEMAAEWVLKFPEGPAQSNSINSTARRWAQADPQAASEWLQSLEDPRFLENNLGIIMAKWSEKAPGEAAAWLKNLGIEPELKKDVMRAYGLNAQEVNEEP